MGCADAGQPVESTYKLPSVCLGREAQTWETPQARFQPYTNCFSSLIANAIRFPTPPKHKTQRYCLPYHRNEPISAQGCPQPLPAPLACREVGIRALHTGQQRRALPAAGLRRTMSAPAFQQGAPRLLEVPQRLSSCPLAALRASFAHAHAPPQPPAAQDPGHAHGHGYASAAQAASPRWAACCCATHPHAGAWGLQGGGQCHGLPSSQLHCHCCLHPPHLHEGRGRACCGQPHHHGLHPCGSCPSHCCCPR
jgi:hypothetical protein